jgi:hypothetical protein
MWIEPFARRENAVSGSNPARVASEPDLPHQRRQRVLSAEFKRRAATTITQEI